MFFKREKKVIWCLFCAQPYTEYWKYNCELCRHGPHEVYQFNRVRDDQIGTYNAGYYVLWCKNLRICGAT